MPGRDGTGPLGQGPLTGRGFGPCGLGVGIGFRRGFGLRARFVPTTTQVELTADEEKKILEAELKEIDLDKAEIQKRLKEIKA